MTDDERCTSTYKTGARCIRRAGHAGWHTDHGHPLAGYEWHDAVKGAPPSDEQTIAFLRAQLAEAIQQRDAAREEVGTLTKARATHWRDAALRQIHRDERLEADHAEVRERIGRLQQERDAARLVADDLEDDLEATRRECAALRDRAEKAEAEVSTRRARLLDSERE